MSAQHTTGLLVVRGYSIYTSDGAPVADTCLTTSKPDNDHANALRLAACWNACDGMTTEDLKACPAGGLLHLADFANAVVLQRDQLLAAVEGLLNALPSATTHPAIKAAKAAIANATRDAA